MTHADRLVLRSFWLLPVAALALFTAAHVTGSAVPGRVLFAVIVSWPPALLLLVLVLRITDRTRKSSGTSRPERRSLITLHRAFINLAILGLLGFSALIVTASIVGRDASPWKIVAVLLPLLALSMAIGWCWPLLWALIKGKWPLVRGMRHLQQGAPEQALECYQRYVERHPDDPDGYMGLATVLLGMGRREEALRYANRAVATRAAWNTLLIRGQVRAAMGAAERARGDFERSYELDPQPLTLCCMASTLVSLRGLALAVRHLEEGVKTIRLSSEYALLGDAYRLSAMYDASLAAYRKAATQAAREGNRLPESRVVLAYALVQLDDLEGAASALEEVPENRMEEPFTLQVRASLYLSRNEVDLVELSLRRLIPISPSSAMSTLTDPQFTHLLDQTRFRTLFAWALGAQRSELTRIDAADQSEEDGLA